MKKIIALVLIGLVIVAHNAFAPEIPKNRLLGFDLDNYVNCFSDGVPPNDKSRIRVVMNYYRNTQGTHKDAVAQFAQLEGDPNRVDTALEWLCASYYHIAIRDIRPPEAEAILPADNPKLADQKIGAAVFQEMQILRFLGDTAAVSRYEAMLKFITDRKNATRQEIEAFYRDNVRALIAGAVDEEFGKAKIDNMTLIQIYADWERRGLVKDNSGKAVNGITLLKETLTNFFLNPTQANYENIRGIYARYKVAYYSAMFHLMP